MNEGKMVSRGYQDLPGVTIGYRKLPEVAWNGYSVFVWILAERCFGRKMKKAEAREGNERGVARGGKREQEQEED